MPELSYKRKGGIALEYCNGQTEKLATATRRIRHLSQFFFSGAGICKCSKNRSQCVLIVATITHGI